jgi:NAD(P)-dependent dehydrogenase (short-subunit alcohol dehydrogenase family)
MGIRLDGDVAIITGGGGAIGGAQARLLASSGAAVVVADVARVKAEAVASDVRASGGLAISCALDVRDASAWEAAVHTAEATFGPVTALANNAGANVRVSFDEQTEAMWDLIVGTILTGSFLGIKSVVPSMRRAGRGTIVNLGSIASTRAGAMSPAYGAAKTGLVGLTRSAALTYAAEGIRCVLVSPGHVDTPFLRANTSYSPNDASTSLDEPTNYATRVAATPMGRLMTPDDVARAVRFAVSSEAAAFTGSSLVVDGGAAM